MPLRTVNRQCSSGLQAVADVATAIKAGLYDIGKCNSDFFFFTSLLFLLLYYFSFVLLFIPYNAGIAAGLECMTVNSIGSARQVNPKVYSTSNGWETVFFCALVPSIKFMMLTGGDLYSSSGLSSSYGYHF